MNTGEIEAIRQKAKQKRYKKPMHKEMNLDSIQYKLYDIISECQDVSCFFEGGDDELLEEMIGGEDEVREFKFMFAQLVSECEQMQDELENEWVPEMFDIFFASCSDRSQSLIGFDSYEGDYMSIAPGMETEWAIQEAQKKLSRYTKSQIIEASCQCFRISLAYLALRNRYEDLKTSMDIIRERNKAELEVIKGINTMYQKANDTTNGFKFYSEERTTFERFISNIDPYSQMWIG